MTEHNLRVYYNSTISRDGIWGKAKFAQEIVYLRIFCQPAMPPASCYSSDVLSKSTPRTADQGSQD